MCKRLVTQLSSRTAEEKKLLGEKKELLANINLHGWLCKRGIKGPTADVWRKRYFKVEEGNKLMYYKTAAEGSAQGLARNVLLYYLKCICIS